MPNAFKNYGKENKEIIDLLEEMNDHLLRIVELLEKQGRISPAG